jgi:glycosyltransferase involved in cell wall biosynthesis
MPTSGSLRLLWLSDSSNPHTVRWVRALAARGHEVLVYSLTEPRDDALGSLPGVSVESAGIDPLLAQGSAPGAWHKIAYLKAVPRIVQLHRAFRADVCHAHYASSYGVLGILARLRPFAVSIWGSDVYVTPNRSHIHRWLVSQVLHRADLVLSTSWTMRQQGLSLANVSIAVVPFGIDMARFAPRERARGEPRDLIVGTVKALEPKYGIDYLIRAFSLLVKNSGLERLRLVIAGDGSHRAELERLAQHLGVEGVIQFLGSVRNEVVDEVYRAFDVAVFPSIEDSESFGVSAVEAQACGIPVIASRVGGLPEVVADRQTGLIVPPCNEHELASAIAELLVDAARRSRMGAAGRQHVALQYDLEHCVDELQRQYATLLA